LERSSTSAAVLERPCSPETVGGGIQNRIGVEPRFAHAFSFDSALEPRDTVKVPERTFEVRRAFAADFGGGDEWIHEIKFGDYCSQIVIDDDVHMFTRGRLD
jgi:hypothetical protein